VASARPVRVRESRNDHFVPGRKVVPSAVPPSFGDAALRDRRAIRPLSRPAPIGAALYRWRSAPEPTGSAPRCRVTRRSVRRLPGPFAAVVAPVSTSHRISLPTLDGYSSRSQPVLRDVGREYGSGRSAASSAASLLDDVPGAAEDRQVRVASERRVRSGELAEDEDGTAVALDPTSVSAVAAESRVRSYQCQPAIPSSAAVFSASSSPLA